MNKRIDNTQIIGLNGIQIFENEVASPSTYINGEYYDVHTKHVKIELDSFTIEQRIQQYLTGFGERLLEDQLAKIMISKMRFEVISWMDDDTPIFTCQVFFKDKLIGETTSENQQESKHVSNCT